MRRPGQREARDVERQTRGTRWPRGPAPWVRASASGACGSGALGDKTRNLVGPVSVVSRRGEIRVQGLGSHPIPGWRFGNRADREFLGESCSSVGSEKGRPRKLSRFASFSSPREPGLDTLTSRNSVGSCQRMHAVSVPNIWTRRLARPFPTARDPRRPRARVKDSPPLPLCCQGRRVVPPPRLALESRLELHRPYRRLNRPSPSLLRL